ncbi:MAG: LVIVD repeat-containing protein [Nitrososphaeraceae archaeon]
MKIFRNPKFYLIVITILTAFTIFGCSKNISNNSVSANYCEKPHINGIFVRNSIIYSSYIFLCGGDVIESGIEIKETDENNKLVSQKNFLKGWSNGIFVVGDYAYLANGNNGLAIVNIKDNKNPYLESQIDTTGYANAVFVYNDIAYVADGESGLQIISIKDKSNPKIVFSFDTKGYSSDVFVDEKNVYIADGENGLQIIPKEKWDL